MACSETVASRAVSSLHILALNGWASSRLIVAERSVGRPGARLEAIAYDSTHYSDRYVINCSIPHLEYERRAVVFARCCYRMRRRGKVKSKTNGLKTGSKLAYGLQLGQSSGLPFIPWRAACGPPASSAPPGSQPPHFPYYP